MTTARGAKLLADSPALLLVIATDLLAGDDFRSACSELAGALLLAGFAADGSEPVARRIQPAIVAEGWQSLGEAPGATSRGHAIADFIRLARAIGLLEREDDPHVRAIHLSTPPPDASG